MTNDEREAIFNKLPPKMWFNMAIGTAAVLLSERPRRSTFEVLTNGLVKMGIHPEAVKTFVDHIESMGGDLLK